MEPIMLKFKLDIPRIPVVLVISTELAEEFKSD
jgi:hypothetical protein